MIEVKDYKGIAGTRTRTVAAWIKTASSKGEIVSWGKEDFGQMFTFGHIRGRVGVTPNGGYLYMNAETARRQVAPCRGRGAAKPNCRTCTTT